MENKKILIVSAQFYPENSPRSFRTTELAKELLSKGNKITVISCLKDFDYTDFLEKYPIRLVSMGKVSSTFGNNKNSKFASIFYRIVNRFLYQLLDYPDISLFYKIKKVLNKENKFDAIISVAAPHVIHWGVSSAIKKNPKLSKIWIADCGDPYMGSTLQNFSRPFYFMFFEKAFCKRCNHITVPIKEAKAAYYKEFHYKIKEIPQGFSFKEIENSIKRRHDTVSNFAYAGGLALKGVRSPFALLEMLTNINEPFVFTIYSNNIQIIPQTIINKLGSKLILIQGISRDELLFELSTYHFLINFDNGTAVQAPSKLIDYTLSGRPILNIEPNFPKSEIIVSFIKGNYDDQYVLYDIEKYNIENVANNFLKLVNANK